MRACLALGLVGIALSCRCAPKASCVRLRDGSLGCMCPFFGDGYSKCEEQRFVTDVRLRAYSQEELGSWVGNKTVGSLSSRRLMGGLTHYVLEIDSSNVEAMEALTQEINDKQWPQKVALLGSATSRIVLSASEQAHAVLELVNVTYRDGGWDLDVVSEAGFFFLSRAPGSPLPCVHVQAECCASLFGRPPFVVGAADAVLLSGCVVPETQGTQGLGPLSYFARREDGFLLRVADGEWGGNLSVGVLFNGTATTVDVQLLDRTHYSDTSRTLIPRRSASHVRLQLEEAGGAMLLHAFFTTTMQGAAVAFVQYSSGDSGWLTPNCSVASCLDVPLCDARESAGLLELWVPVVVRGNLTLNAVLLAGGSYSSVVAQCSPEVAIRHCLQDAAQVQVFQGLSLKELYRGPPRALLALHTEPQTDTLITLVARGTVIGDMLAIHTSTEREEWLVSQSMPCATCVVEQLVLDSRSVSRRSCYVFGDGDARAWIEGYGLGFLSAVMRYLPADVLNGPASAAWVNPSWPQANRTFLHVNFRPVRVPGRRLLMSGGRRAALAWRLLALVCALRAAFTI